MPAKVQGIWRTAHGDLTLTQQYQMISGTLGTTPISEGRLRGSEITFTAGGATCAGQVNGNAMQGTASPGGSWSATKR